MFLALTGRCKSRVNSLHLGNFVKNYQAPHFTRQLGVAPTEFIDVPEVKDGKITTYGSTITEQALPNGAAGPFKVEPKVVSRQRHLA
jgi:hypothetical protein